MFGFLKIFRRKKDVEKVAEEQLRENISTIESLRDYDTGKKNISTSEIERRLPDIRVTHGK